MFILKHGLCLVYCGCWSLWGKDKCRIQECKRLLHQVKASWLMSWLFEASRYFTSGKNAAWPAHGNWGEVESVGLEAWYQMGSSHLSVLGPMYPCHFVELDVKKNSDLGSCWVSEMDKTVSLSHSAIISQRRLIASTPMREEWHLLPHHDYFPHGQASSFSNSQTVMNRLFIRISASHWELVHTSKVLDAVSFYFT